MALNSSMPLPALAKRMVVDAHHHLWDLSSGHYPWLQQDYDERTFFLGDYRELQRDFLPQDFRRISKECGVIATVHVEAERARNEQVAETDWLHQQYAEHGMPNAVVAHVWLDRPETEDRLLQHLQYPLLRGIRSKPLTASTPGGGVHGLPGSMQDDRWLRGLALLDKHQLSWDLRVPCWHLKEAAEVAELFPTLSIVLNHHGFAWDRSEEGLRLWRDGMERLAEQPNVYVKLSEFGLPDQVWSEVANTHIVHETLRIFGWERCLFASNFPVAGLRIGYSELIQAMWRMVAHLTPEMQHAVMCDNALRFYRIQLPIGPTPNS
jgi:predicted TIM-barrel fold metal-dependent hydrolase